MSQKPTDVSQNWQAKAMETLKTYYLAFEGSPWHKFDKMEDDLLTIKICYAMYGPPTEEAETIEQAYSDKQRKAAEVIRSKVFEVKNKCSVKDLQVGFIFIFCKQEKSHFTVALISVFTGTDTAGFDKRMYVDLHGRIYKDWEDWKENNCLPKVEYAYPKLGFYTCSGDATYKFDIHCEPDIEFGTSPACNVSSTIFGVTDTVSAVVSIGASVVGAVAIFTPLAPLALTATAAYAGAASASYGLFRGISRLVDKGTHGESLTDFESLTIWLGIAATPLNFTSSIVNASLVKGAQQGRIMSRSMRLFATVINFTALGVDSLMITSGFVNLVDKYNKDELTKLDVFQFTLSAFFFTNTLMQPKVASSVIKRAQEMHLNRRMEAMTDEAARETFKGFIEKNQGDGGIQDRSKIIRSVNRMNNPEKFFKSVSSSEKVVIASRKGRTMFVTDEHSNMNKINPNRYLVTQDTDARKQFKFNKDYNKLHRMYGSDPYEVELNGEKVFRNMEERTQQRVTKVFGGSAKYNKDIVDASHSIAESLGVKNADDLMSVIEIVSAHVSGQNGAELTNSLSRLNGEGKISFVQGIARDKLEAVRLAQQNKLSFDSPLMAVYHYRKHGAEFPKFLAKFGDGINVYLGPVSDHIFNDVNLKEVYKSPEGLIRKTYYTDGKKFGVITSTPNGQKISTMFENPSYKETYIKNLSEYFKGSPSKPVPMGDATKRMARNLGLRGFHVYVMENGNKTEVDESTQLDPAVLEEIVYFIKAAEMGL